VGTTRGTIKTRKPIFASDIKAAGAMAALLKDAVQPNLVQTLENNPALIHGGPFANIAHGCNSVIATKAALKLADYVVTEGGFGADLGAEKFFDIKCRKAGLTPEACVVVATVRALKLHGGAKFDALAKEDVATLEKGMGNLKRHVENLKQFGVPVVVCVNQFPTDTQAELEAVAKNVKAHGAACAISSHWADGGRGAQDLAEAVVAALEGPSSFAPLYPNDMALDDKIRTVAQKIYRASDVIFTDEARAQLNMLNADERIRQFPVCMAKTQYSFSDDPSKLNAPEGHTLTVRELRLCSGAEFVVALTGSIMTMPGLPKIPSAENIHVKGAEIFGLF